MKKIFIVIIAFIFCSSLFSQNINIGVLNGPTCIPAAYLMNKNNSSYNFEVFSDPSQLIPKMIKQEIDIGFLPVNVAAKVYKSSKKQIVLCAVVGNGNLSLITKDKSIKKISDLKGKTVYMAGHGATPEYMFSYLIEENGLSINEKNGITLDYSIPVQQIPAMLINNKINYAIVPQPFSTIAKTKSKDVIEAIDLQREYESFEGEGKTYPISVMVVGKKFAEKNPEILEAFLNEYNNAVEWTLNYPSQSGKLCSKMNLGLDSNVVAKAIPDSNYVFIPASEAQEYVEKLLTIFLTADPESIGGTLPDEWFYYSKEKFFEK